ncbi:MAG: FAD-binding oxidoreductase [Paracoccaceae bacterium]
MTLDALSKDFSATPFWQASAGGMERDASAPLPDRADVVIVGAGLTGASAGEALAAAGRSVVLLDAGAPGGGASSRNGAMLGRYFKHSFGGLMAERGLDTAKAYFNELSEVYEYALARIRSLPDPTGLRECGRVVGAVTPAHREKLCREWELRAKHNGEAVDFLDGASAELPTGRYCGGIHIVRNAAVHPGLYTRAMLNATERAGAAIHGHTPAQAITREGAGFVVHTPRGRIAARDVLIATNGYTPAGQAWHHRRLIPIVAFMMATEPLPPETVARLRAGNRTYHDNRKNSTYYQLSADGRLVLGGRTGLWHRSPQQLAARLRQEMAYFFPELADVKVAFAWSGKCAATEDLFPHVGQHQGMHFALGYCFSGLAMAPWLGRKAAMAILGRTEEAQSLFRLDAPRAVPWPKRQEWLIPLAMQYFRWQEPLPR